MSIVKKAKRTDLPNISRDWLCKLVFAVDGARWNDQAPEHLTDLIDAITHGSTTDIEREIEALCIETEQLPAGL